MPLRRRMGRRRRISRRLFKRKGRFSLRKKVARLSKAVRGEIRQYSALGTQLTPTTTPGYLLLNGMAVGDNDNQRQGQKITIWSISVRYYVQANGSTAGTNSNDNVRCWIVLDKQANAAVVNSDQQFNSTAGSVPYYLASKNFEFRQRYKFLMDRNHSTALSANTRAAVGATTWDGSFRVYKFTKRWPKGLIIYYNTGTAGTIADIVKNSIYFGAASSNAAQYTFVQPTWNIVYSP